MKRALVALLMTLALSLGIASVGAGTASATPNPGSTWTTPCSGTVIGYLYGNTGAPRAFTRGNWYNYTWNQGWLVVWDQGWPYWVYYPQWC